MDPLRLAAPASAVRSCQTLTLVSERIRFRLTSSRSLLSCRSEDHFNKGRSMMNVNFVLLPTVKIGTVSICVCLLLLAALLINGDLLAASKGPEVTTKGYSIF